MRGEGGRILHSIRLPGEDREKLAKVNMLQCNNAGGIAERRLESVFRREPRVG
jgi:hypothetical protein